MFLALLGHLALTCGGASSPFGVFPMEAGCAHRVEHSLPAPVRTAWLGSRVRSPKDRVRERTPRGGLVVASGASRRRFVVRSAGTSQVPRRLHRHPKSTPSSPRPPTRVGH